MQSQACKESLSTCFHCLPYTQRSKRAAWGVICAWRIASLRCAADKARDKASGEVVALKKVRLDRARDGLPVTSARELRVLQQVRRWGGRRMRMRTRTHACRAGQWRRLAVNSADEAAQL